MLLVGCIYRPGNCRQDEEFNSSISFAASLIRKGEYDDLMLVGDFNFPNITWQNGVPTSVDSNEVSPARIFVDNVADNFLVQHINFPTFHDEKRDNLNTLDLLFTADPNRISRLQSQQSLGNLNRGHLVLSWDYLVSEDTDYCDTRPMKNYYKANFDEIKQYFRNIDWYSELADKSVDSMYSCFLSHYQKIVQRFVPTRKPKTKRQPEWLKADIKCNIKEKNALYFRYSRGGKWPNKSIKAKYDKLKNIICKQIKIARRNFEKSIILQCKTNPKSIYKYIKKNEPIKDYIRAIMTSSNELISNRVEISNVLNNKFQSVFVKESISQIPKFEKRTNEVLVEFELTIGDVEKKLLKLDVNKAMGPDGVHAKILKETAKEMAVPLTIIFRESLDSGTVPQAWKDAFISPLFKKGSKLDPNNYRPVSLTSIPCKILESLVKEFIYNHLERHNLLCYQQHGFVKQKSCTTNLLETIDIVSKALNQKKEKNSVDVVYLDFAKAFDTVPHKRLLTKLEAYGISGILLKWIQSFLSNRRQRVRQGEALSDWCAVTSGVPQGSVLGPLLFVIYINDLPDTIKSIIKLFADDTKLIRVIREEMDSIELQEDLFRVSKWSEDWLISFNELKCKVIHYGKKKNSYTLKENGRAIDTSNSERDLGVKFSSDLKWKAHIQACVARANSILGRLKKTFTTIDLESCKLLYTSLIRPHIEFAVPVWSPYLIADINELEKLQKRVLKWPNFGAKLTYEEKLKQIGLTTLKERRLRGDLIQLYKWFNGIEKISPDSNPTFKANSITRGHQQKYSRDNVKNCAARYNFILNRTSNDWNDLPETAIKAPTLNHFKAEIDSFYNWNIKDQSSKK